MNLKKFFYTLSGDDYSIIITCKKPIQHRFIFIGIFVTSIFLMCFISLFWTIDTIFHSKIIGLIISIFISWMIVNIYLLLLYTLSKNLLPHTNSNSTLNTSVLIRVIFIVFIAIVISKPLEVIVFSNGLIKSFDLNFELETYKQKELKKYDESISMHYDSEIKKLNESIKQHYKLHPKPDTNFIMSTQKKISELQGEKIGFSNRMKMLVSDSNYFIRSIILLNTKNKYCWMITFLIIAIFLAPAYLKNSLPNNSEFYTQKKYIETKIVQDEYDSFKMKYVNLINQFVVKNIQFPINSDNRELLEELITTYNSRVIKSDFSEPYIDAPFNTIRKRDERKFLKEDDLISDLYNV